MSAPGSIAWRQRLADRVHPVTRKRWRRFLARRRAVWALGLLAGLYLVSLGAELICNDRPLYVRFRGQSYFPVLKFYPAAVFEAGGPATRPDYRRLAAGPAFAPGTGNFMLFTPVPYGPYESLDPESLRHAETVTLRFLPRPRVGNVNVRPDLSVARGQAAGFFFDRPDDAVPGLALTNQWQVPAELAAAIRARFLNQAAPAMALDLAGPRGSVQAALAAYVPRAAPPDTVRITLREPQDRPAAAQQLRVDAAGRLRGAPPAAWTALATAVQTDLLAAAQACYRGLAIAPRDLELAGGPGQVQFQKNEIRWPYPPTRGHWLGIDGAGRDVLARILYGLRTSMSFGFLLVAVSMALGILLGAVQGYYAGRLDITLQRLIEIWSALPFLYVMILLGSVYGRSFSLLLACYAIFNWIGISYYIRAEFLRLRRQPYVDAARALGVPARRIIWRHILPNAMTPVITFFPFMLVGAIGSLAALDYLGFGLPPPQPSWGELFQQAQSYRWAWWLILYPSLALFTVMLLGVFVGEGVRDAYDPRPFSRME